MPPNILFMMADDLGNGDLSSRQGGWETPNIDRLRAEGTDFLQFQLAHAVCSPSRAAALTGRYPCRYCIHMHLGDAAHNAAYGMPDWLDPQAPTMSAAGVPTDSEMQKYVTPLVEMVKSRLLDSVLEATRALT